MIQMTPKGEYLLQSNRPRVEGSLKGHILQILLI